jgi:hypothetical protein
MADTIALQLMMTSSAPALVWHEIISHTVLSVLVTVSFIPIFGVASPPTSYPADYERNVAKWQEVVPEKNPPESYPAGSNVPFWDVSWRVYLEKGQILADANPEQTRNPVVLPPFSPTWKGSKVESDTWVGIPVEDGWLVAFNVGEFGADVVWYNHDGSKQYEVAQEYVDQFLVTPDGIFGQGGLAHMGTAFGGLYRFDRKRDQWQLTHLLDTSPNAPIAWLGNHTLLIVMSELCSYSVIGGLQKFATKALPATISVQIDEAKLYSRGRWAFTTDKMYIASGTTVTETDLHTRKHRALVPDDRFVNDRLRWEVSIEARHSEDAAR